MIIQQNKPKRIVTADGDCFRVRFDYNPDIVAVVKSIPGRQWSVIGRFWIIPINKRTINAIIGLRDFGFILDNDAKKFLTGNKEKKQLDRMITMGKVEEKIWFGVKFFYDEKVLDFIHTIDGRKWQQDKKYWLIPVNSYTISKMKRLKDEYDFKTCDLVDKKIENIENLHNAVEDPDKFEKLGGTLRPFQKIGVEFILKNRKIIVGDQMGLGKTMEAIAAIYCENAYPALIVCPSVVKLNWKKEINKWVPDKTVCVINSRSNKILPISDYYIINYDILNYNQTILEKIEFKAGVADESQFCKNPKSARTKATMEIFKEIDLRILLTGTPVRNKPAEIIMQLKIINKLDDFGGWWRFVQKYCDPFKGPFGWDISGASNVEELNRILRLICYIRRNKEDVLPELPDKIRSYIPIKIDNREEYENVRKDITNWFKEKSKDSKMRNHISGQAIVKIEALKQIAAKGKLHAVKEWVDDFLSTEEKLVIFAHHRMIVDWIYDKFKKVATKIQGGMTSEERQKSIDDFQNDDKIKIIVVSIMAGGIGINLTAASNALFVEQAWSPADHDQAEDRLHRIGQKNSVNYYYLVGKNTIDEMIVNLIAKKRKIVDGVTEGNTQSAVKIIESFLKGGKK